MFHPNSIAVVGASNSPSSMGYSYVHHLMNHGYRGRVYPVTRRWPEVLGLRAYPAVRDIPDPVDYIICCIPASQVVEMLAECSEKGVKVVHFYTGRFRETGKEDSIQVEREVLRRAREYSIRILGPNCMGLYYPKGGMAFAYGLPHEPGKVGMFSQSGGAATEFVRYASLRGIRFSKVISYGNALDLNEADFLEYLCDDPETQIIAGYLEDSKAGVRFLNILSRAASNKPVIVLKAGRGKAGTMRAASHTGALAGSVKTWEAAIRQAGAIQVRTLEEMTDQVASFYFLPKIVGTRVGIGGAGGGRSVLSADEWEEAGFTVAPLPPEIEECIRARVPALWWGWIGNPIDISILPDEARQNSLDKQILRMMANSNNFDLVVVILNVGAPFSQADLIANVQVQVEDVIDLHKKAIKPLAVVVDVGSLGIDNFGDAWWRCLAESKSKLLAAKTPVYHTATQAASSIMRLVDYYRRRSEFHPNLAWTRHHSGSQE